MSVQRRALLACVFALSLLAACGRAVPGQGPPADRSRPQSVRGLTSRLVLDRTDVQAGRPIPATLVVRNESGHVVRLRPGGCDPAWGVTLTNSQLPATMPFTADCEDRSLRLRTGVTRLATTVSTRSSTCTNGHAGPDMPRCAPHDVEPLIPPGVYRAVLVGGGAGSLPVPSGVVVRIAPRA